METDRARKRIYLYKGVEFVLQMNILPNWGPRGRWILITDIETLKQMTIVLVNGKFTIKQDFLGSHLSFSIPEPASVLDEVRQVINHACFHLLILRLQNDRDTPSIQASTCDKTCGFYDEDFRDDGYQDGYIVDAKEGWDQVIPPNKVLHNQIVASCLSEAKSNLASGSLLSASQNAWGTIAHCVRAISLENGWPNSNRTQIHDNAMKLLSANPTDEWGITRFLEISTLYRDSYESGLESVVVRMAIENAEMLVQKLRSRSHEQKHEAINSSHI